MKRYGMRLRPAGLGCQPDGFIKYDQSNPKYHNVIYYDRELTKEEMEHYNLDDLDTQKPKYTEEEIIDLFEKGKITYEEAKQMLEAY